MAKIDIRDHVAFPMDKTYPAFRDKLPEVAPYLPDVESITVKERTEVDADTLKLINLWKAAQAEIPSLAKAFIKPDMLKWEDHAVWHDEQKYCEWNMVVSFLPEAVTCKGRTSYTSDGERTQVHIDGELSVDAGKIPGVPRLLAGKVGPVIEAFVVKLITPNLRATNRAMEKYLADQ